MSKVIEGQLNAEERRLLITAILAGAKKPEVVVEIGTWLGGGSTLHILRALEQNGTGHLWGVEADPSIYQKMVASVQTAAPEAVHRFTPLLGFSDQVLPEWIAQQPVGFAIDFAFLDGGNRPSEQITEFLLLSPHMPVGAQLMAHDAKLRKGKWLVPYVSQLDNWRSTLHDVSDEGLFAAAKVAPEPSPQSVRKAERQLLKMRLQPTEVAAVLLPHRLRAGILKLIPPSVSHRLSEGRHRP